MHHLQNTILPSLLNALQKASRVFGPDVDKILIIVLTPADASRFINVHVAVTKNSIHGDSKTLNPNVRWATILGPPRQVPIGKDSAWVKQRHYLEKMRPESNTEIVLCTQDGRLLEGLVTNLYVIQKIQHVHKSSSSSPCGSEDYAVYTAQVEEGVVWGTMRKMVLFVCERIGLTVKEEAPKMSERHMWEEAFLSNR